MSQKRTDSLWLGGYILSVIVGACLLAPLLFWMGRTFLLGLFPTETTQGILAGIRADLQESPFSRFFNRSLTFAAICLIWPASRGLNLGKEPRKLLGLGRGVRLIRATTLAFALSGGSLLLLGGWLVQQDIILLKTNLSLFQGNWGSALLTGWGVGLIEEILFRGAILGICLSVMRVEPAVIFSSLLFAIVHFLKATDAMEIPNSDVTWLSGFVFLGKMLSGFTDYRFLLADFTTLFIVGIILAWYRLTTHAIWGPAALHAGWVFGLKYFADVTRPHRWPTKEQLLPLLGDSLKSGLIPLSIIILTWYFLAKLSRS